MGHQTSRALTRWKEFISRRNDARKAMTNVVRRLQSGQLGRALVQWRETAASKASQRDLMHGCVLRMGRQRQHAALRAWVGFVRRRGEAKGMLRRAVSMLQ